MKVGFVSLGCSKNLIDTEVMIGKFKNKEYNHILVKDGEEVKDAIRDLVDNYDATLVKVDTMETLSDNQRKNNDNYLSIMNDFITNIGNITLK